MIQTFKEILAEHLENGVNSAKEKFREAIRPIYGADEKGRPKFIGTCFFIEYKNSKYLITAAHVVDNAEKTPLFIGGGKDFFPIPNRFFLTVPPNGNRDKDFYDFAFQEIKDDDFQFIEKAQVILEADISPRLPNLQKRVHLALGYPRSKNKKVDPTTSKIRLKRLSYFASWDPFPEMYFELGLTGNDHIAITRRSQSRDTEGVMVNSIGPVGMSGGPLLDLGRMVSMTELTTRKTYAPKLAGILIEHDEKHEAIVAVRIDLVLKEIDKTYPKVSPLSNLDGE